MKTPMTAVANSGAEEPAAMKVAPATSCDICNAAIKKSMLLMSLGASIMMTSVTSLTGLTECLGQSFET